MRNIDPRAFRYRTLIHDNIDRLDRHEQTFDDFRARNRRLWDEIRDVDLLDDVLELIRRSLPTTPMEKRRSAS